MGNHRNRLDAKGRVSIPAPFRTTLRTRAEKAGLTGSSLVLRPSHKYPCIEGWPEPQFEELATQLHEISLFSQEHDDLAGSLYAEAFQTESDKEGRIVLPDYLTAHAGVTDALMFMGLGRMFQIWEPVAGERRIAEARRGARTDNLTLPGRPASRPLAARQAGEAP